jgi:hypothetical protein
MIVPMLMAAYVAFVWMKTLKPSPPPEVPQKKNVPVASVAPPHAHCGEDLRGVDPQSPDDAVVQYQQYEQAITYRKLANPELAAVLRSLT